MVRVPFICQRLLVSPLLVLLLLLLPGCGSSPSPEASAFDVRAGTLNFSSGPGMSVMYEFDLKQAPTDGTVEVTITGPAGWNNDIPATTVHSFSSSGTYWGWRNVFRGADGTYLTVQSGTYTFEASLNGRTITRSMQLDASDQMPDVANLTIESGTQSEVSVSWSPVPGARSYLIELYSTDDTLPRGLQAEYVTATTHTFQNLALSSTSEYYVAVQAFASDFTASNPALPAGPFNSSFGSLRFGFSAALTQQGSSLMAHSRDASTGRRDPSGGADELPVLNREETAEFSQIARTHHEGVIAERAITGSGFTPRWDKGFAIQQDGLTLLGVPVEGSPTFLRFIFENEELTSGTLLQISGDGKYPVCHAPPGNPAAAHTLFVDPPALKAHVMHGDSLGYCDSVSEGELPRVELALVDLTEGTVMLDSYGQDGDRLQGSGPWAGVDSLEELTTPVPEVMVPQWLIDAVHDKWYTGPVPEIQSPYSSMRAASTNDDNVVVIDDGGGTGGSGGEPDAGEDDDNGGTPDDGSSEDPGDAPSEDGTDEPETPECKWSELDTLDDKAKGALDDWEDAKEQRILAEAALAGARRRGFATIVVSTGVGALAGSPGGLIGAGAGAFAGLIGGAVAGALDEQDKIDILAYWRQKEAYWAEEMAAAVAVRKEYILSHDCEGFLGTA